MREANQHLRRRWPDSDRKAQRGVGKDVRLRSRHSRPVYRSPPASHALYGPQIGVELDGARSRHRPFVV
jgi:hypothetical protein